VRSAISIISTRSNAAGRNRIVGAMLSEHGPRPMRSMFRGLKLANGRSISLTDRTVPREVARNRAAFGVPARVFSTVLGPGLGTGITRTTSIST